MSIDIPHPLDALSVNETNLARDILLAERGQYSPLLPHHSMLCPTC